MPQRIKTLDEYVATVRKKDTLFVIFDTQYNISLSNMNDENIIENLSSNILSDAEARKEFIQFMQKKFPNVELVEVMESSWGPYSGTIAIDTDINSDCYNEIVDRYENEDGKPLYLSPMLYIRPEKDAKIAYEDDQKMWESEI